MLLSSCVLAVALAGTPDPTPVAGARMKAIVYRDYGTADVLALEQLDRPVPKADQILVHVRAASVNPLDWHMMRGTPFLVRLEAGLRKPDFQQLGVDFAGVVEAIGKDVTRFKPGDEVFGGRDGALAEYVAVRESRAVTLKPSNVTFEQAAAVPIAAVTALQGLRDTGRLQPGQKVLINGASGGVGTFAVQLAKALGAEVTGVCSTKNLDLVRSLGAEHVIDYTKDDFTTAAERYDLILDCVGNHPLMELRRALTPHGTLVAIGGGGPNEGRWIGPIAGPIRLALLSPFVSQRMVTFLAELKQEDLAFLGNLMASGKLTPVVDRRYSLAQAPQAIRYLEEGHARGKVVVDIAPEQDPVATPAGEVKANPAGVISMGLGTPLLAIALVVGVPIAAAIALNRRFRRRYPGKKSYRWGYYFGIQWFAAATAFAIMIDSGIVGVSVCALVSGISAWFFAQRHRWAWLAVTLLSLNPVAWVINFFYLRKRWAEDGAAVSGA